MNLRRILKMVYTPPNSSAGLIIRAEILEDSTKKMRDAELIEKTFLYAEVLRQLAAKKLTPAENRNFIAENLREMKNP